MNVKRIAAVAAGAAMLASSFAAAVQVDSGLGSFQFLTNGEPAVKVVVGSRAAASDAVAAGNIAAMLGNLAYKEQPVTVLGTDTLSCAGGTGGTGAACDLTNKKVTLTVTTPGINPASAFAMQTYVQDYL
ncbi:MAG: S-layer protein, partial [Candidatus Micrarchaeota archaeon]